MHLEHVNLTVSDLDASLAFYRDLFGFKVRWQGTLASRRRAAHVGGERFYVALFEAEHPGRADYDYARVGLNHFGLVVDSLDGLKTRMAAMGIQHGEEQSYDPGRRLYLLDPDGIEIELVEYATAPAELV